MTVVIVSNLHSECSRSQSLHSPPCIPLWHLVILSPPEQSRIPQSVHLLPCNSPLGCLFPMRIQQVIIYGNIGESS